jgi:hypothetical protein
MYRSGQLGLRYTIEPNCSGLSARLIGASVTRNCALDTCESSCVLGAARPFFIPMVHSPLEAMGYVTAPEPSSRGGRTWSHVTRGSTGTHLSREVRSGAEEHVTTPELNSARRRGPEPRDTWQHEAHLSKEVRYGAVGHVVTLEPTSTGRYDLKV